MKYENLIIGSGLFGLSIARELLNKGEKVCIIDRYSDPNESSVNALGRIDPILGGAGHGNETKAMEVAKKSLEAYKKFISLNDQFKESIEFEIKPTIHFYNEDNHYQAINELIEIIDNDRIYFSLEKKDYSKKIHFLPNKNFKYQSIFNGTIFINSKKFRSTLFEECNNKGLMLITDEIKGIERLNEGIKLVSQNKEYLAERLIIAAGPWSSQILGDLSNINIFPSKGQIIKLIDHNNSFTEFHLHGPCSVVKKRDGLIWVAATVEDMGFDKKITSDAAKELIQKATLLYEGIDKFPIHSQTACLRPSILDDLPAITQISNDQIYLASGGGGWGIMMSIMVGELMTELF